MSASTSTSAVAASPSSIGQAQSTLGDAAEMPSASEWPAARVDSYSAQDRMEIKKAEEASAVAYAAHVGRYRQPAATAGSATDKAASAFTAFMAKGGPAAATTTVMAGDGGSGSRSGGCIQERTI
ncbi:unnamed protein product [Pylaiella littoralis]